MNSGNLAVPFLIGMAICSTQAIGQNSVTLAPVKDNTLYESEAGTLSNAKGNHLFAGRTNGGAIRRALLQFDIAGNIPAGSQIDSVVLILNLSRTITGEHTVTLHRVLADWGEADSQASGNEGGGTAATPGDATWVHTFFDTAGWQQPGGDFSATASAAQTVADLGRYSWGSTPEMVADVQAWLDTSAINFGWLLHGDETACPSTKRFDSRENPDGNARPALTVFYSSPTAVIESESQTPRAFSLEQNFPNPFNAGTTLYYTLRQESHVNLSIYDLSGRRVATVRQGRQAAGSYSLVWDGRDDLGRRLVSGLYVLRLRSGGFEQSHKLVLLR